MPVESIFDFRFPPSAHAEGLSLAQAIGADMPSRPGFVDYRVIQDVADRGHLQVATRWDSPSSAHAVLKDYANDAKVLRAKVLLNGEPAGFVGEVLGR